MMLSIAALLYPRFRVPLQGGGGKHAVGRRNPYRRWPGWGSTPLLPVLPLPSRGGCEYQTLACRSAFMPRKISRCRYGAIRCVGRVPSMPTPEQPQAFLRLFLLDRGVFQKIVVVHQHIRRRASVMARMTGRISSLCRFDATFFLSCWAVWLAKYSAAVRARREEHGRV